MHARNSSAMQISVSTRDQLLIKCNLFFCIIDHHFLGAARLCSVHPLPFTTLPSKLISSGFIVSTIPVPLTKEMDPPENSFMTNAIPIYLLMPTQSNDVKTEF